MIDLRPYQQAGADARVSIPSGITPELLPEPIVKDIPLSMMTQPIAPSVPVPAIEEAVRQCPEATGTPDTFGQSCGCTRECKRAARSVTYPDCYQCRSE